jgi:hypothetical protein
MGQGAGKRNGEIGKVEENGVNAGEGQVLTGLTALAGLLGRIQSKPTGGRAFYPGLRLRV